MYHNQSYDQYELNQQNNRVRVEDALSYLDQVKTQFHDEPSVYTQFLDIMKDFKSQQIDTPGVITRELDNDRDQALVLHTPAAQLAQIQSQQQPIVEGTSGAAVEEAEQTDFEEQASEGRHQEEIDDEPSTEAGDNQFDLALDYVNKIKRRFANNPTVYKKFLDILHGYQSAVIDPSQRGMADAYIMDAVAEIFADDPDLLEEFKYFLPECQGLNANSAMNRGEYANQLECFNYEDEGDEEEGMEEDSEDQEDEEEERETDQEGKKPEEGKKKRKRRTAHEDEQGPLFNAKRRWKKEQHFGEVIAKMSIKELSLYERMKAQLDPQELNVVLRLMNLYSNGIATSNEFLKMLRPVLKGRKELMNEIRELLGENEEPEEKRPTAAEAEQAQQIDYATCRLLGVSYRKIADDAGSLPLCSGRTKLCNEVLNDTWASFPSWASEDSSSVSSKKTAYEEFLYRTEDERFELDILIEINKYAIEALEKVRRMVSTMSAVEQASFKLDDKLGASSGILMTKALKRVFGEQLPKYVEMLRKKPAACVDRVVDRLKEKENEWRDMQCYMNKVWREQNEKNYIRSLDHQTTSLRNSDAKWLKTKTLLHHVETLFDERQQKSIDGQCEDVGPHLILKYPEDRSILDDASDLIIHYIKRQANIQKDEKRIVKRIMRKYVRDWFGVREEPMSDDEEETPNEWTNHTVDLKPGTSGYRLIYGGNNLFLFFRLHQFICERLGRIKAKHAVMIREYKPPVRDPTSLYQEVLNEIKNLLDSSIELSQFEDNIRMKFPVDGYVVFTMDKLIALIAKSLVSLANDADCFETLKQYDKFRMEKPPSVYDRSDRKNTIEAEYKQVSETKLNCKNCFLVYVINEEKPIVTVELVDTETEIDDPPSTNAVDKDKGSEMTEETSGEQLGESDEAVKDEKEDSKNDAKKETGTKRPATKCFLKRNVRLRKTKGFSQDDFATFDCKYQIASGKAKMIGGTVEGLIKKRKIDKTKRLELQKAAFLRRHERAKLLRREKGKCALLSENSTASRFKHPNFPWLSYLVYTRKT
ncbi:hypothetical protein WR25_19211 [Diploscapter pachys]|uniref:Histone deacetylase interacting domain-containing protein n=1 Tax=Diploscapter pachys TaxID=2018661 RepID=A0A2A2KRY9_9BILA|nr:hypothetical protein WR25_19211 [Diploscapter pachys]